VSVTVGARDTESSSGAERAVELVDRFFVFFGVAFFLLLPTSGWATVMFGSWFDQKRDLAALRSVIADGHAQAIVDNGIGPFICVGEATGAGGANVWDYEYLRALMAGTDFELPVLPAGIGMSFAFRRATRAGPSEGLPIEDVGIRGAPYAMTRDDLLAGNPDLLAHCFELLKKMRRSSLRMDVSKTAREITVRSAGLTQLDVLFDGHPGSSFPLRVQTQVIVPYPAGTKVIELFGFDGEQLLQKRRVDARR